jgi:CheY-like chemotaxis protein
MIKMTETLVEATNATNHTPQLQLQPAVESASQLPLALVVDDDPDFLDQQEANLKSLGFQVTTACSETGARELLSSRRPDVAVVDLMMENSDAGFALCYHLKQLYPRTPVIMVTSAGSITGYDFESMHEGQRRWVYADAVLSKPMRLEQLKRELARLMKG